MKLNASIMWDLSRWSNRYRDSMTLNWVPVTNRFPGLLGVLDSKGCQYELRRWKPTCVRVLSVTPRLLTVMPRSTKFWIWSVIDPGFWEVDELIGVRLGKKCPPRWCADLTRGVGGSVPCNITPFAGLVKGFDK